MASNTLTVAQLRTLVAAIPTARNTSLIVVPDSAPLFPVVTNYVNGPTGESYTVQGYVNWQNKTFDVVV
jgi:hypothetical protein